MVSYFVYFTPILEITILICNPNIYSVCNPFSWWNLITVFAIVGNFICFICPDADSWLRKTVRLPSTGKSGFEHWRPAKAGEQSIADCRFKDLNIYGQCIVNKAIRRRHWSNFVDAMSDHSLCRPFTDRMGLLDCCGIVFLEFENWDTQHSCQISKKVYIVLKSVIKCNKEKPGAVYILFQYSTFLSVFSHAAVSAVYKTWSHHMAMHLWNNMHISLCMTKPLIWALCQSAFSDLPRHPTSLIRGFAKLGTDRDTDQTWRLYG